MNEVSVVGPGDGETIHLGPVRMRILEDGSTTEHRLGIGEITLAPHTEGPPQHRHAQHDEGFYVVSGTVHFTIGETTHVAPAGTLAMIPPGAPHTFANPGDEPAVMVNTFTPDLYVRYFRDLRDMIAGGRPLTPESAVEAMRAYATVPATDYAPPLTSSPSFSSSSSREVSMSTTVHTVRLPAAGPGGADDIAVDITVDDQGDGRAFLLLHGGGGPQTVTPFAGLLAGQRAARVVTPVHPGFGSTLRPDGLTDVATLARLYAQLLEDLDLTDVTVVGNSIGGWIAAELALLGSERVSGVVLVNAAGILVPGHPVADTFSLTPAELSRLAFHDPAKFAVDPAALPESVRAVMAAGRAALEVYSGPHAMSDPTLAERLAKVTCPALVAWGASDQVVDVAYGRAYAAAIPGARFELIPASGHLPQIETPDQLLALTWDFAVSHATDRP